MCGRQRSRPLARVEIHHDLRAGKCARLFCSSWLLGRARPLCTPWLLRRARSLHKPWLLRRGRPRLHAMAQPPQRLHGARTRPSGAGSLATRCTAAIYLLLERTLSLRISPAVQHTITRVGAERVAQHIAVRRRLSPLWCMPPSRALAFSIAGAPGTSGSVEGCVVPGVDGRNPHAAHLRRRITAAALQQLL